MLCCAREMARRSRRRRLPAGLVRPASSAECAASCASRCVIVRQPLGDRRDAPRRRLGDRHPRRPHTVRDDLLELVPRHARHVDLDECTLRRSRSRTRSEDVARRRPIRTTVARTSWSDSVLIVSATSVRDRGSCTRSNSSTKTTTSRCLGERAERLPHLVRRHVAVRDERGRGPRLACPPSAANPTPRVGRVTTMSSSAFLAPQRAEVVARVARRAGREHVRATQHLGRHAGERRLADAALAVDDDVLPGLRDAAKTSAICRVRPAKRSPLVDGAAGRNASPTRRIHGPGAQGLRGARPWRPVSQLPHAALAIDESPGRRRGLRGGGETCRATARMPAPPRACSRGSPCSSVGEPLQPRGRYQFQSPSSFIAAGSSTARTIVASIRIAAARPKPSCFMSTVESVTKIANTATITVAAAVTTPAVDLIPCATASSVEAAVVGLPDAAQDEHVVVHREAEEDHEHEQREPRGDRPVESKPRRPRPSPTGRRPRGARRRRPPTAG